MDEPSTPSSLPAVPAASPVPAPVWAVVALLVSGIALMVMDTADVLFFFGLGLTAAGLYLLIRRTIGSP
jgi:hypothetical protein